MNLIFFLVSDEDAHWFVYNPLAATAPSAAAPGGDGSAAAPSAAAPTGASLVAAPGGTGSAAAPSAAAPSAAAPGGAGSAASAYVPSGFDVDFSADIDVGSEIPSVLGTLLAGLDSIDIPTKHMIFNFMNTREVFRFRKLSKLAKASVDEGLKHIELDLTKDIGRPTFCHVALTRLGSILRDLQNIEEVRIKTSGNTFHFALYLLESLPHLEKVKRLILHNQTEPRFLADILRFLPRMPQLKLLDVSREVDAFYEHSWANPDDRDDRPRRRRPRLAYQDDTLFVDIWRRITAALPDGCRILKDKIDVGYIRRDLY